MLLDRLGAACWRRPRRSQYGVSFATTRSQQLAEGAVKLSPHHLRARALLARQRSAGCYGVAPNEMGSRQNSLGPAQKRLAGRIEQISEGFEEVVEPYVKKREALFDALRKFAQDEFQ
jgi:hypothetical protein